MTDWKEFRSHVVFELCFNRVLASDERFLPLVFAETKMRELASWLQEVGVGVFAEEVWFGSFERTKCLYVFIIWFYTYRHKSCKKH
jgi:hypothetical protein